jgi:hypothetical protein
VVPFALVPREEGGERVVVLFHTKEVGKKVGYLVDFGGATSDDEGDDAALAVAARELSEETAGVFDLTPDELAQQPIASNRAVQASPLTTLAAQRLLPRLEQGLAHLSGGGDAVAADRVWHGSTHSGGYEVFFVRVPYFSADRLNELFSVSDRRCRFQWVGLDALLPDSPTPPPLPLHPRLVAIHRLPDIWTAIDAHHHQRT